MGKDTNKDTYDSVLKRLKKTLRNKVHLDTHWPDSNVINAYFEPTVDSSKETFQWGLPDLDSLRSFFKEYLRWDQEKTDHYLIPAIEAQNRRSKRQGTQTTLDRNNFFDLQAGEGVFAGRERPGYHSSRLQQIVNNFRASNTRKGDGQGDKGKSSDVVILSGEEEGENDEEEVPEEPAGKANGKKSRPAARKRGAAAKKSNSGKETTNSKRQKGKRKASETSPVDNVHDQEWRPAKAKRPARMRAAKNSGVTSLYQARNMDLDSINDLPPSRAMTRDTSDSQLTRPIVLSNDEDESSLTEQE
jgi:DNA excision repair protein ERCC-5